MKRLTAITMAVFLVISGMICLQFPDKVYAEETAQNADVWDGTTVDISWYDANNVKTEYTLTTAAQLAGLAELVNQGAWGISDFIGITIKLGTDIILNEGDSSEWADTPPQNEWTPIGDGKGGGETAHTFRGVFDGQGHTISGMYINATDDHAKGLFGRVIYSDQTKATPAIKNFSLVNSYIKNTAAQHVGMAVGSICEATDAITTDCSILVENIYVQGEIDNTFANARIGGACGVLYHTAKSNVTMNFNNIISDVDVVCDTAKMIGGIACCDITNTKYSVTNTRFEQCVNLGDLECSGDSTVGGIFANSAGKGNLVVTDCVNAGNLKGQKLGAAIGSANVTANYSTTAGFTRFINIGAVVDRSSADGYNGTGILYGGPNKNSQVTSTFCYSVATNQNNGVTVMEKEQLTSMNALQTLASKGFDATNWTMVSGIAPLPTTAATMCGLTFKTVSLTLDSSMQMNFKVLKNAVNGYKLSKVVFALNGDTKEVTEYTDDGDYYVFSLSGIAPYQMQDKVTATLYGTYDTINFSTLGSKLSISDYCYAILNNSDYSADTYATLRTLIVDLLNYGAESQKRDGKTEDLVNAELTTEQQAMASVDRELVSVKQMDYETVNNPSVTWKSAGLNLTDKVVMRLKFSATDTTGLKVQFRDGNGHTVDVTEFTAVPNEEGCYYVYLSELNAYQMSDAIYATVFNAEGTAVSNTMCYSVESYAYDAQNMEEGNLGALVKAMMRYGNSAKAYQER